MISFLWCVGGLIVGIIAGRLYQFLTTEERDNSRWRRR